MVTHDTLMEFCKDKSHFTKNDFLNYISDMKYDLSNIDELLEFSPYIFSSFKEEELYTTRASVFNGSFFKIELTPEEMGKKILYIGHRFVPFYPSEIFPSELVISEIGSKKLFKTKMVVRKVDTLYDFYKFLGAENIIDSLLAEDGSNSAVLKGENNSVKISVFDLKDLTEDVFVNGNQLYFKVVDWNEGILNIVSNNSKPPEESDVFFDDFENALRNVFISKGPGIDIPEQLALAYYELTLQKNTKHFFDLSKFISSAKDIKLTYYEDNSILWFANDDSLTKEYTSENNSLSISDSDSASIDEIFYQMKIPLSKIELEAFFKDSMIKNEKKSPLQIVENLFNKNLIVFKDEFQKTSYENFVEEIWEIVRENFINDDNAELKELRSDILTSLRNFYLTEKVQKIDVYDSPLITLRDMLQHMSMCNNEKLKRDDISFIFKVSRDAIADLENI